jgi:hypothetical protein
MDVEKEGKNIEGIWGKWTGIIKRVAVCGNGEPVKIRKTSKCSNV